MRREKREANREQRTKTIKKTRKAQTKTVQVREHIDSVRKHNDSAREYKRAQQTKTVQESTVAHHQDAEQGSAYSPSEGLPGSAGGDGQRAAGATVGVVAVAEREHADVGTGVVAAVDTRVVDTQLRHVVAVATLRTAMHYE